MSFSRHSRHTDSAYSDVEASPQHRQQQGEEQLPSMFVVTPPTVPRPTTTAAGMANPRAPLNRTADAGSNSNGSSSNSTTNPNRRTDDVTGANRATANCARRPLSLASNASGGGSLAGSVRSTPATTQGSVWTVAPPSPSTVTVAGQGAPGGGGGGGSPSSAAPNPLLTTTTAAAVSNKGSSGRSGTRAKARAAADPSAGSGSESNTDGVPLSSAASPAPAPTPAPTTTYDPVARVSETIQSLPSPKTFEEYTQMLPSLDRFRCPLGPELSPAARAIYGPTTPFNSALPHSRVLGHVSTPAPNCNHREPIQIVAGKKFYVPVILAVMLAIYCALNTVAYRRMAPWPCLLVMWLLWAVTVTCQLLCSLTNPGIVPHRTFNRDIKDRSDIIVVRVPAPNARRVQRRQREVAAIEAAGGGGVVGDGSLDGGNVLSGKGDATTTGVTSPSPSHAATVGFKRRNNITTTGLERFLQSDTGRLTIVPPLFSEQERRYKFKDGGCCGGGVGCCGGNSNDDDDDCGGGAITPTEMNNAGNTKSSSGGSIDEMRSGGGARREVAVVEFPLSYCWTCGMYKAPRTHHCSTCNVCVDDHDHHCPWTACCIGRNNYRFFFMSLVVLHLMASFAVLMGVAVNFQWMVQNSRSDFKDLLAETYYLLPLLYALAFAFGIFFTPLLIAHVYMSCKGFTTSEMLKSKFKGSVYFLGVNPWDSGIVGNYMARLLGRYEKWTDTRYYYAATIAGILEDVRVDWLIGLPPAERKRAQAAEAALAVEMEEAWTRYNGD